jgi:hypothetical protein
MHPRITTCPAASDPASLRGGLRTSPPCPEGLRCCHMSYGSGPHLPAQEGSGDVTYHTALNPASLVRRVLMLSRVLRSSEGRGP